MKSDWKNLRLGSFCDVIAGGTPPRSNSALYGGSIPWVKISDMLQGEISDTDEKITEEALANCNTKLLPEGTILLSIFATIGRTAVLKVPATTNQAIVGIIPRKDDIDKLYFRHFLNAASVSLASKGRGVAQNNINSSILRDLEIPLPHKNGKPDLVEQKRIAAILDKADAIRRKRQQALRLTDEFLRSVFLDMFGDPVTNPKKLPKVALSEIIKLKSGNSLTAKNMTPNGSYPVYGGNGINGYHDQYMFKERKVVLGRVGAYCGAVHYTQPYSWITDNALFVDQMKRPMNSIFLVDSLRIANLNQYAGQAGQPLISGGRIYPIEILEPSSNQQDAYASIIEKTHATRENHMTALNSSACLFSSLQQRAFRGEL